MSDEPKICTLTEDANVTGQYRVEACDDNGTPELSVFAGPDALDRAIAFAGGPYYDGWNDPQALGGC